MADEKKEQPELRHSGALPKADGWPPSAADEAKKTPPLNPRARPINRRNERVK